FFFFFSSRRRHTRCLSDWSSDVCSSDLGRVAEPALDFVGQRDGDDQLGGGGVPALSHRERGGNVVAGMGRFLGQISVVIVQVTRSEERRVGKECRSRWTGIHLNRYDQEV